MNLKRKTQSGFTMIEIMVVVVIVAILAVIALPTYLDYVKSSYASEARTVMSNINNCLLYTSPSPRDRLKSRMPSSA